MFSGIVETIGTLKKCLHTADCSHFTIAPHLAFDDIRLGDSIAVNGVCLTVTDFSDADFHVTAVPETLRLTNLSQLTLGSTVNLERSLQLNSRLGGHYVQGHVDGIGELLSLEKEGEAALIATIKIPHTLSKYIVKKGYITLDGMSITLIETQATQFKVTFIPHTQAITIVNQYRPGSHINIEVDILGKYVAHLLEAPHASI